MPSKKCCIQNFYYFFLDIFHDEKKDTDFDEEDLSTTDLTDIFKGKIC